MQIHKDHDFWAARYEHAWLLRAEGFTYREIAKRFGVCTYRANQMVWHFSWEMRKAIKKTKFNIQ